MAQNERLLNFLSNHVLIFLTLCLKLYLNTLEYQIQLLSWVNSFLALFWLFRILRTLHFGFLPFSNQPAFDQKWSKKSFWASNDSKSGFLDPFCQIMSYFSLTLCLKLYLNTLEHKSQWFLWVNSFLCLFQLFRGPLNYNLVIQVSVF